MNISPSLTTLLTNNLELIQMLLEQDGNRLAELADRAPNHSLKSAFKQYADTRLDLAYRIQQALPKK
jgi:hypothetical protein